MPGPRRFPQNRGLPSSLESWYAHRMFGQLNTVSRRSLLVSAGIAIAALLGYQVGRESVPPDRIPGAPLIGIASLTSDDYVRAVRDSGGIPVVLPNADGSDEKI